MQFAETCQRKVRHRTLASAQVAQHKMAGKCPTWIVDAYYCWHCDGFHVGKLRRKTEEELEDEWADTTGGYRPAYAKGTTPSRFRPAWRRQAAYLAESLAV